MFTVHIYADAQGNEPITEYIEGLAANTDKDSRIKLNKITDYIQMLKIYGTRAGEPFAKHIEGKIWELRPLRDRIFFFALHGNAFVLLHHFVKKTQKTPQREIDQAKRNMEDLLDRLNK